VKEKVGSISWHIYRYIHTYITWLYMWVEEGEEESGRQDSERGMDQVPKHLPSKIKVLSSNPSMPPQK
jgi:hypothetical protein